jgi:hypothetical protein
LIFLLALHTLVSTDIKKLDSILAFWSVFLNLIENKKQNGVRIEHAAGAKRR